METKLRTLDGEIEFYYKNQTTNKRGPVINYLPKCISGRQFKEILDIALYKTDAKYMALCEYEWNTLKNPDLTAEELAEFYNKHPFWKKESFTLLHNYWQLYSGFTRACRREKTKHSKNIISTNNNTCITSIQRAGDTLIVFQRSCDISLGLFADAITIQLIKNELNLHNVIWLISIPHIYVNNYEQTIKYFSDIDMKRPKMTFNVRKERVQ